MYSDYKRKGITLLKKGQKGIVHALFSRFGLILLLFLVQVLILFSIFQWFEEFLPHILGGTALFTFVMVIYLLNSRMNPTAKITWLIVIALLPVFGVLLLLYTQSNVGNRAAQIGGAGDAAVGEAKRQQNRGRRNFVSERRMVPGVRL